MRILLVCTALFVLQGAALGQGAVIEKLADVQGDPLPPDFRGTLPTRVDLSAKLPGTAIARVDEDLHVLERGLRGCFARPSDPRLWVDAHALSVVRIQSGFA